MRLGGFFRPETVADLSEVGADLDRYGLSAVVAPRRIAEMTDDEALEFGEVARTLGIVVGESIPNLNLMVRDEALRTERVDTLRAILRTSDLMGCHGSVILVGSVAAADRIAAVDPYMLTDECRAEFRELVLRILDGLELGHTKLLIEPWPNSFFYRPEPALEFLESLDHPLVGLHLDQMNMVDQDTYFDTTELIDRTFDLLSAYVCGVHFKDVLWDWSHMLLKLDEVLIGDGVLDYHTYLRRLLELDGDVVCFCEHLATEADYAENFSRLHRLAGDVGFEFERRVPAGEPDRSLLR
jgi:sugar phosphate isomerase/epimerase